MRIAIDLTPSIQHHAGLGRYAEELAQALQNTCPPDEQVCAFFNDPQRRRPSPPLDHLPTSRIALSNKLWRAQVMAAHIFRQAQDQVVGQPDVFYATDHLLPYLRGSLKLFTLADATFLSHPQTHSLLNRVYLQTMIPRFLHVADAVIAISKCTWAEAQRHYPSIDKKCHIIYPGVNKHFQPIADDAKLAALRTHYQLPNHFILYVGTIEPRKNLPTLVEAFKETRLPNFKLVIAGRKGWLYDETFTCVKALGLEQDVIFTGFVADGDLPALYSLAEVFVFPSLYEGFGLPVLEAMACGTPVISSNTSSLPEVAGDAALLVAPDDVRGWAEAMRQVTQNTALRADLRERGLRQAARFTWEATAHQTRALYRELYGHRP